MYINEKKPVTFQQVRDKVRELAEQALKVRHLTQRQRQDLKEGINEPETLDRFCKQIAELNDAIISGRSVWAECVKEPRNLDSGKHYFSVWYVNKEGIRDRIWGRGFAALIGQDIQDRDRHIDRYVFSSGVIGMSRQLDAIDGLFTFLKAIGGTYCQL